MLRLCISLICVLFLGMPALASPDLDSQPEAVESENVLRDWHEYWACRADATSNPEPKLAKSS